MGGKSWSYMRAVQLRRLRRDRRELLRFSSMFLFTPEWRYRLQTFCSHLA
jgi:hypothetical protein